MKLPEQASFVKGEDAWEVPEAAFFASLIVCYSDDAK